MSSTGRRGRSGPNLEFLPVPALILDLDGEVRSANSAARSLRNIGGEAASLFDVVQDSADHVATYLRRATASTSSHIGSITLGRSEGVERFRALSARVQCVRRQRPWTDRAD